MQNFPWLLSTFIRATENLEQKQQIGLRKPFKYVTDRNTGSSIFSHIKYYNKIVILSSCWGQTLYQATSTSLGSVHVLTFKRIVVQKLKSSQWLKKTAWNFPRPCPPYAGGIWKRSLPSTLIRHENGAFRKRSSDLANLKTSAFRFRVDEKHFENGAFLKWWRHDNHVTSLTEFSSNTNPKWPVIAAFLNSLLQRSVDRKLTL